MQSSHFMKLNRSFFYPCSVTFGPSVVQPSSSVPHHLPRNYGMIAQSFRGCDRVCFVATGPRVLSRTCLGLTRAEVFGFHVYIPGQRLVGAVRIHLFAVQRNSMARL